MIFYDDSGGNMGSVLFSLRISYSKSIPPSPLPKPHLPFLSIFYFYDYVKPKPRNMIKPKRLPACLA